MRVSRSDQLPLVPQFGGHEHMCELDAMSSLLDAHPQAADWVLADLLSGGIRPDKGREGLSGEQVLRAALLKQLNGYSYDELAFHLADSLSYRAFCRIGYDREMPAASALQRDIKRIRPETMEAINRLLVGDAKNRKIENGQKVRSDCTVMESNIHKPTDSSLLWDCVRVVTRLLHRLRKYGGTVPFSDHTRRAKRRFVGIESAKSNADRTALYKDLIIVTDKAVGYAKTALDGPRAGLPANANDATMVCVVLEQLHHYLPLIEQVLDQTRRRVLQGQKVPSAEKTVSIFEPHTDVIVKDRRETLFGHKLCLTAGASGLVLDCVVHTGNPADSTLAVSMIERQTALYGQPPRQAVFDGGFASRDNLDDIKHRLHVQDVAFSKSRGIDIPDMVKSAWVYRRLRRFRAGIESIISFLKRSFGWRRCTWRSFDSFRAYAWTSVVAANLLVLARHTL
jgi:transposase, IS5 family